MWGRALVTALEGAILDDDNSPALLVWANARVGALPLYERGGYRVVGPVFEQPDAGPHRRVWRRLR